MQIPIAIDFSNIYAEKILYSETIQYKILKEMDEPEWKSYKSAMLKENINVSYDATTDSFIAKPLKESRTLTESRSSGNLNLVGNVISFKPLKENILDGDPFGPADFARKGNAIPVKPSVTNPCNDCEGEGFVNGTTCHSCGGTGSCPEAVNEAELDEYENSEMEYYGDKTGKLKETELEEYENSEMEYYGDKTGKLKESQDTKKNLLLDGEDEEENDEDFDSSMEELLNFDDDDDDEETEATGGEEIDSDDEIPTEEPVEEDMPGVDTTALTSKLEQLINNILDSREGSGKSQFKEIPGGEINSDLGDFGAEASLPPATPETNVTPTEELLSSEFPVNQDKIDIIKDRLDSELTYQDYLNGETDATEGTDETASMMDIDDEDDCDDEVDMLSVRSDDYEDEAGESLVDDNIFTRNAELTGGLEDEDSDDDDEEELIMDADEVEETTPEINKTVNIGGTPIKIVLTGMVISESEIKGLFTTINTKGLKLYKLSNLNESDGKNGYKAFYKGKQTDVYANSSYEAQQKAAAKFGAKKSHEVTVVLGTKDGKQVTHSTQFIGENKKNSLDIFVECNNKKYKIHYEDVPKTMGKKPFSIKDEKFTSLNEALDKISGINRKSAMEKLNFHKMVDKNILASEKNNNFKESTFFEGFENIKEVKSWNVKVLGNISLKTGVNEVLSNITGKGNNTLVKTNEGQYFLIKGSLNENSKVGTQKELVDLDRRCEYGVAKVIGVYENTMKGLGQIMEKIQRTNIPLLIWK